MLKCLLPFLILLLTIGQISSEQNVDVVTGVSATISNNVPHNVDSMDALDYVYGLNPLLYIIIVGMSMAITALSITIKILWNNTQRLILRIEELHESRIRISIATTEAITESIALVEIIHNGVLKLNDSESSRRLFDVEIKNHLVNIEKDLNTLKTELDKLM